MLFRKGGTMNKNHFSFNDCPGKNMTIAEQMQELIDFVERVIGTAKVINFPTS